MTDSQPIRTAEDEVILLAARGRLKGLEERLQESASRVSDWDRLQRYAEWHGITPLLYHHLSQTARDAVPTEVMSRLQEHFATNSRRALLQLGELHFLLSALNDQGISAIPFKGPVASTLYYDRPGLRVAGDLDVLILREDALAARNVLQSRGYRFGPTLTESQDAVYRKRAPGYVLNSPHHHIIVDLQWELSPQRFSFKLPVQLFRTRLETVRIQGLEVPTFSPPDMFVALCVHGSKHAWESLKWLVDIAELLRRQPGPDLESALSVAEHAGCRRAVLLGLLLASRLLDAPVSMHLLELAESDRSVAWMASRIEERTFGSAPSREGKYQIEMRLEDTAFKQARYLWRRILTPAADEWVAGDVGLMSHIRRPAALIRFLVNRRLKRSTKTADT